MTIIQYNNQNPFGDRTPLISRTEGYEYSPGGKTSRVDTFTLEGRLKRIECDSGFESIYELTKQLILAFSENFKKFEVIQDSTTIFSYDNAIVDSISFEEDKYYDLVPYTIVLRCYKDYLYEQYGVLEPTSSFSFEETDGCLVNIVHNISCRGVNNSDEAIDNAKAFINAKLGYNPAVLPDYMTNDPILVDRRESVDRRTATVSVTEVYRYDKNLLSGDANFIQTTETEQKIDNGIFVITVSGTLQGSRDGSMTLTRAAMVGVKGSADAFAQYEYSLYKPSGTLFTYPSQSSISEDLDANTINYSFTYSEAEFADPYISDSTTISREEGKDCISTSIDIKSLIGCPAARYEKTKAYLDTLDLVGYVMARWSLYGYGTHLSSVPDSKSVSINNENGDISVSISFCTDSSENCGCIEALSYNMTFEDPIPQFSEEAAYRGQGCYSIQNLKYNNRAKFGVSGSCRPSKCCSTEAAISQTRMRVNQLMAKYFQATNIILEKKSVEYVESLGMISFDFAWNGLKPQGVSDEIIFGESPGVLLEDDEEILLEDDTPILLE